MLCRMSLPFASWAERRVNSDIHNKPFKIACEHTIIVFKFENEFISNLKIILAREDVAFKLPLSQITGSSRCPFLRFFT